MSVALTKDEKSALWWFYCGNVMFHHPKLRRYVIYSKGFALADLSEDMALSLVNKKAILPIGLSIKEWKVQVALGVVNNAMKLTELGVRAGTEHTEWTKEFREEQIMERMQKN